MDHFDPHRIFGVVEVDDVDVKDQNGGAGNEFSCGGNAENIRKALSNEPKCTCETHRLPFHRTPSEAGW